MIKKKIIATFQKIDTSAHVSYSAMNHVFSKTSYVKIVLCILLFNLPFQRAFAATLSDSDNTLQQKGILYITQGTVVKNIESITAEKKYIAVNHKSETAKKNKSLAKKIEKNKTQQNNIKQNLPGYHYTIKAFPESVFLLQNSLLSSGTTAQNDNQIKKQYNYELLKDWDLLTNVLILINRKKQFLYKEETYSVTTGNFSIRPPPAVV